MAMFSTLCSSPGLKVAWDWTTVVGYTVPVHDAPWEGEEINQLSLYFWEGRFPLEQLGERAPQALRSRPPA